jgi:hypothetical protein
LSSLDLDRAVLAAVLQKEYSVRALQMVAWQQEPELRDIPQPQPGPGEVLLKVEGPGPATPTCT